MTETRTQRLELGPEPRLTRMQRTFVALAAEQGWNPLVIHTEHGVTAIALKVEPVRVIDTTTAVAKAGAV